MSDRITWEAEWEKAFTAGVNARRNGDGLAGWITLSAELNLDKNALAFAEWNEDHPPLLKAYPGLMEQHPKLDPKEYQHFNEQVARMPRKEIANRARVYQVSYNIGQLHSLGDTRHSPIMNDYVNFD